LLYSLMGKQSRVSTAQTKIANLKSYISSMAVRVCFVHGIAIFYRFLDLVMNSSEIVCHFIGLNTQSTNTGNGCHFKHS
jgi:hypothetical protein